MSVSVSIKVTVIYQLIAVTTIPFSWQKGAATKQGQLLYSIRGQPLNLCRVPGSSVYTVFMFQT